MNEDRKPPSFSAIADLFQISPPHLEGGIEEPETKREGATAEESTAYGRQALTDGDVDGAIRHFKRAIEQRDATDITSRIDLAGALAYADQLPQAYREYEKALRIQQDAPEPHVGLGELLVKYGRFRDAVEEIDRAIQADPNNPLWRVKLADTLRQMGERKRALAAMRGAVILKPDEPFYHYWIGDLLLELDRNEDALESLRAAIELSPGDDHLYLLAAIGFWRVGRRDDALKSLKLAADLDPDKRQYAGLLQRLLIDQDRADEALIYREEADLMDRFDLGEVDRTLRAMRFEPNVE